MRQGPVPAADEHGFLRGKAVVLRYVTPPVRIATGCAAPARSNEELIIDVTGTTTTRLRFREQPFDQHLPRPSRPRPFAAFPVPGAR